MMLTERRMPIPVKITPAIGYNCTAIDITSGRVNRKTLRTYHTNTPANGSGERAQNIHGRIEPFGQFLICTTRLIEARDVVLERGEDVIGRIAGFEF